MEQKRAAEEKPGIKICGITTPEEAVYLNEAGVSYAGFVFFPKSKRNVTYEQAEKIFSGLDPSIKKVAVFVSPTLAEIQSAEEIGADILQIHGTLAQEMRRHGCVSMVPYVIEQTSRGERYPVVHQQSGRFGYRGLCDL